nr:MAG TPA: hypothetical protein [Caudoviricetes sp.]
MNPQGMIPAKENANKKISDRYQKKTYAKGATCIYGDTLYRAKADITTAEEWTDAHWEETNMETIRAEMAAELSSLNAKSAFHMVRLDKGVNVSTTEKFYTGIAVVIPANSYFSITVAGLYVHAPCKWLGISTHSENDISTCYRSSDSTFQCATVNYSDYASQEITIYIYGQWQWAGQNEMLITGYYVTQ